MNNIEALHMKIGIKSKASCYWCCISIPTIQRHSTYNLSAREMSGRNHLLESAAAVAAVAAEIISLVCCLCIQLIIKTAFEFDGSQKCNTHWKFKVKHDVYEWCVYSKDRHIVVYAVSWVKWKMRSFLGNFSSSFPLNLQNDLKCTRWMEQQRREHLQWANAKKKLARLKQYTNIQLYSQVK